MKIKVIIDDEYEFETESKNLYDLKEKVLKFIDNVDKGIFIE